MAVTASIEIEFESQNVLSPKEILESLIKNDWSLNVYGEKHYIPLGEKEIFAWKSDKHIKDYDVLSLVEAKTLSKEIVALGIGWKNTNIGGELIFDTENSLILMLTYNRQVTEYGLTNFDWYLSKLVPIFSKYYISSLKCEQIF